MRAFLVVPLAIIIPFTTISVLMALTGDAFVGVVLAMTLFVTVAAWFSGLPVLPRRAGRRR